MENSVQDSDIEELYLFTGSFKNYLYTPAKYPIVGGGLTYLPLAGIKRTSIKIGSHEEDNDTVSVSVPVMSDLAQENAFSVTPPDLALTIYRTQRDSGVLELLWKGPVAYISVSGLMAKFQVSSSFKNILQGSIPTAYMQPQCNHVFLGEMCRLNRASYTTTTTVTATSDKTITVGTIGAFAADRYVGGEILSNVNGERRAINSVTGTTISVPYEFTEINVGDSVEIVIGCDHSWAGTNGCLTNNNRINYGGFPYLAGETSNVFRVGIV